MAFSAIPPIGHGIQHIGRFALLLGVRQAVKDRQFLNETDAPGASGPSRDPTPCPVAPQACPAVQQDDPPERNHPDPAGWQGNCPSALARFAVAGPRNTEEIRMAVFRGAASANGTAPSARGTASAACRPLPTEPHHPAARSPRSRSFPQNGSRFRRRRRSTGNGIRPFFAHQTPAAHHRFRARQPPAIQSAPHMNRPRADRLRHVFPSRTALAELWQTPGELSSGPVRHPPLGPARSGPQPSCRGAERACSRPCRFLEIVLNKQDSLSAIKDYSLFMEQEHGIRAKTFFDFSSLRGFFLSNRVFSKLFSPFLSAYNFFDSFFLLPPRNFNPAFSQIIRRFGACLP